MRPILIGVDAGTTNIKTVAFDRDGGEIHQDARSNEYHHPRTGWVEQDMAATWQRTADSIRAVVNALEDPDAVAGVGVTGQGDGCWLIDDAGSPVRDAILWNDGRAASYVEEWEESGIGPRITDECGSDLFPGASLPILQWLTDNEPEVIDRAATVFHCKDWLKYKLTGVRTMDRSDASLPFLDIETGEYSDLVPDLVGIPGLREMRPPLRDATEVVGTVTESASEATGLPAGTPVVSGVIDVIANAIGTGAVRNGDSSSVVGTTSVNQTLLADPPDRTERKGFLLAAEDDFYVHVMAPMAGTPNLDWAFEELVPEDEFETAVPRLADLPVGSEGVLFHPYLSASGERSPFQKATARAGFVGLAPDHTRYHLLRAVYEGVALAMRDCYEHIAGSSDRVTMSGGGARSEFWCQMFADCLGTPVAVPRGEEFGAKGVAVLAGVGAGVYDDLESAADHTTSIARNYDPDPERVPQYDEWYWFFRRTYETMFEVWDDRADTLDRLAATREPE
jgi:xylulokinase